MGTSWLLRGTHRTAGHVYVRVFAGPDPEHRAHAGELTLKPEEWADLQLLLGPFPAETVDFEQWSARTLVELP